MLYAYLGQPLPQKLRRDAGNWLRALRERRGLSQRELAKRVGIGYYSLIAQLEHGRGRIPSSQYLVWAQAWGSNPMNSFAGWHPSSDPGRPCFYESASLNRHHGIAYLRARQAIERACCIHPSVSADCRQAEWANAATGCIMGSPCTRRTRVIESTFWHPQSRSTSLCNSHAEKA
jgi:transcriptional regulator with XRE-family HTH domain